MLSLKSMSVGASDSQLPSDFEPCISSSAISEPTICWQKGHFCEKINMARQMFPVFTYQNKIWWHVLTAFCLQSSISRFHKRAAELLSCSLLSLMQAPFCWWANSMASTLCKSSLQKHDRIIFVTSHNYVWFNIYPNRESGKTLYLVRGPGKFLISSCSCVSLRMTCADTERRTI